MGGVDAEGFEECEFLYREVQRAAVSGGGAMGFSSMPATHSVRAWTEGWWRARERMRRISSGKWNGFVR
ncbi:hypothetical protein Acor_17320 [Acrocarpospora corrugata]|uniref:Uncharacterized protein n=1 Tax=Acrocarpospora corrugata TaxID=35763 RepID=A0A5M3VTW9_9ACTN|nr:hypothetical protein Acor_17320 [Acrocarpospora corrugata]